MTNVSTSTVKKAYHRFPWLKLELEPKPEPESESLSENFTSALDPWTSQALASRDPVINESRVTAHDLRLKQSGFFDLGISLLILAMSGGAMYLTDNANIEDMASAQESIEVTNVQQADSSNENLALADSGALLSPQ